MGLRPGQTNNPGGRPAGSRNKNTEEIRQNIQSFIIGNLDQLQSDFNSLEPKDRIVLFERLLRYVIPPMSATSITHGTDEKAGDMEEIRVAFLNSLKR
jgi:hypothetical protein